MTTGRESVKTPREEFVDHGVLGAGGTQTQADAVNLAIDIAMPAGAFKQFSNAANTTAKLNKATKELDVTQKTLADTTGKLADTTGKLEDAKELHETAQAENNALKTENSKLATKIATDALTKAGSLDAYRARMDELLKEVKEGGKDVYVALVDYDNFKSVNTNLGHDGGDRVLVDVSAEIMKNKNLELYRTGGDEFVIIAKDATTMEEAMKTVDGVRKTVEDLDIPFDLRGTGQQINIKQTISLGVTKLNRADNVDYSQLSRPIDTARTRADEALEAAKLKGKNIVVNADIKPDIPQ